MDPKLMYILPIPVSVNPDNNSLWDLLSDSLSPLLIITSNDSVYCVPSKVT
jgi:hypothetical protein